MPREIRPELSTKSKHFVPRERYYELKHWCLQYPDWKKRLQKLTEIHSPAVHKRGNYISDPTADKAIEIASLNKKIELLEDCAKCTDEALAPWIRKSVTENLSCNYLLMHDMPCTRDKFYELYRRFFYILDQRRD